MERWELPYFEIEKDGLPRGGIRYEWYAVADAKGLEWYPAEYDSKEKTFTRMIGGLEYRVYPRYWQQMEWEMPDE
jgi:hypothetical protein